MNSSGTTRLISLLWIPLVLLPVMLSVHTPACAQWVRMNNLPASYNNNHWLDVFFLPSNPQYGWVCGYKSWVLRTTDGGNTWEGITADDNDLQLESIHFPSPTVGYTSGGGRILKSTDGGRSWFDITPDDIFSTSLWGCYFVSPDTGVVIGGGCFDGRQNFYRTTDGGQSWTVYRASIPNVGMTDAILYSGTGLGYASGSGTIWQTLDGGRTWDLFELTGGYDWQEEITNQGSSFLVPVSGSPCGGDDGQGGMRMTTDDGATWRQFRTGHNMYGTFLHDAQRGWACGGGGSVYYTPDGGRTWRKRDCGIHPTDNLDDIWFVNDTLGWVVGDGVYKLQTRLALPTHLTVEGSPALCEGDSVVLTAPAGYRNYLWSTGAMSRSIAVSSSGTYYATAWDSLGCPYDFDTVAVTIRPPVTPGIAAQGPLNFCIGDSVMIAADPGYAAYQWSTGDTTRSIAVRSSGEYYVRAFRDDGCSGVSDTIAVNVHPIHDQLRIRTDADGAIAFDTTGITERYCRDIVIVNTHDTAAFVLAVAGFADNIQFSLPPGQFPLAIAPLDSVRLTACYTPARPDQEYDTLVIADNCSEQRAVVYGGGGRNIYNVEAQCDVSITLRTIAYDSFLLRMHPLSPNPSADRVRVPLTIQAAYSDVALLRCVLYDRFGTPLADGRMIGGIGNDPSYNEFSIDVSHLAQGVYYACVHTPYGSTLLPVVVRR